MARTPSVAAHEKVLEAATRLMIGEQESKARAWTPSRGGRASARDGLQPLDGQRRAVCIDVANRLVVNRLRVVPPEFRSGNPRRDLLSLLTHLALASKPARLLKLLPRLIGYAATNPKFAQAMRQNSMGPSETQLARILDDAVERGVLKPDLDREIALNMLIGPIMHCRMTRGAVPARLPGEVVDCFWRSWGVLSPCK